MMEATPSIIYTLDRLYMVFIEFYLPVVAVLFIEFRNLYINSKHTGKSIAYTYGSFLQTKCKIDAKPIFTICLQHFLKLRAQSSDNYQLPYMHQMIVIFCRLENFEQLYFRILLHLENTLL